MDSQRKVPCLIDVGGVGAGVVDQADGFTFIPINSSELARLEDRYMNTRCQLWFDAANIAREGLMDLSRLPSKMIQELGRQLLAPVYDVDSAGRLRVEEKAQTKKRIRCSPDHADAFNLAWLTYGGNSEAVSGHIG